jgi:hypothetical protein
VRPLFLVQGGCFPYRQSRQEPQEPHTKAGMRVWPLWPTQF